MRPRVCQLKVKVRGESKALLYCIRVLATAHAICPVRPLRDRIAQRSLYVLHNHNERQKRWRSAIAAKQWRLLQ